MCFKVILFNGRNTYFSGTWTLILIKWGFHETQRELLCSGGLRSCYPLKDWYPLKDSTLKASIAFTNQTMVAFYVCLIFYFFLKIHLWNLSKDSNKNKHPFPIGFLDGDLKFITHTLRRQCKNGNETCSVYKKKIFS